MAHQGNAEPECRDRDIRIAAEPREVRIHFSGRLLLTSSRALRLNEGDYPPVYYLPEDELDRAQIYPSDHKTYCPFKGYASYYHLDDGVTHGENAVWYYANPCALAAPIQGHVAFWGEHIQVAI